MTTGSELDRLEEKLLREAEAEEEENSDPEGVSAEEQRPPPLPATGEENPDEYLVCTYVYQRGKHKGQKCETRVYTPGDLQCYKHRRLKGAPPQPQAQPQAPPQPQAQAPQVEKIILPDYTKITGPKENPTESAPTEDVDELMILRYYRDIPSLREELPPSMRGDMPASEWIEMIKETLANRLSKFTLKLGYVHICKTIEAVLVKNRPQVSGFSNEIATDPHIDELLTLVGQRSTLIKNLSPEVQLCLMTIVILMKRLPEEKKQIVEEIK